MNLNEEQTKRYKQMAEEHAEFLCETIFKPAFRMAFLHGAKHMYEEVMTGPGYTTEVQINIPNWSCPKCGKSYEDNTLACPECQSLNPNAFVDDDPDDPPSNPTEDAMEAEAEKRYMVITAMDDRVCSQCLSMAGKILSGTDVGKGMGPPYHGNKPSARQRAVGKKGQGCRCVLEELGPDTLEKERCKTKAEPACPKGGTFGMSCDEEDFIEFCDGEKCSMWKACTNKRKAYDKKNKNTNNIAERCMTAITKTLTQPILWEHSQINRNGINILHRSGIKIYKDLCKHTKKELLLLRGFGIHSLNQTEVHLRSKGLSLIKE